MSLAGEHDGALLAVVDWRQWMRLWQCMRGILIGMVLAAVRHVVSSFGVRRGSEVGQIAMVFILRASGVHVIRYYIRRSEGKQYQGCLSRGRLSKLPNVLRVS